MKVLHKSQSKLKLHLLCIDDPLLTNTPSVQNNVVLVYWVKNLNKYFQLFG